MFFFHSRKKIKEEGDKEIEKLFPKDLAIIDYLEEGILFFDKNNYLILVNKMVEQFFSRKREDLLGKTIFELNRFPEIRPLSVLLGSEINNNARKKIKISDKLILEVTISQISSKRKRIGTLVILDNITEKELVRKMKSEFLDLATHQLWTPISGVKWSLKMLLEGEFGKLNKEQEYFLREIYKANDKEIKLIGDLEEVSQIEAGGYLSDLALADIEKIIKAVIREKSEEIRERGLDIFYHGAKEGVPMIMMDEKKMRLAITNILDNAIKYTPSGGEVDVWLKKSEKEVEVEISDNGVGIPADQQKRIFTKFFRAGNVIQKQPEGTGLGLYIAKNIIELHGGNIWFTSQEGKGTTFFFTLPIKKEFAEFITNRFY